MKNQTYTESLKDRHDDFSKDFQRILFIRKQWLTSQTDDDSSFNHSRLLIEMEKLANRVKDHH